MSTTTPTPAQSTSQASEGNAPAAPAAVTPPAAAPAAPVKTDATVTPPAAVVPPAEPAKKDESAPAAKAETPPAKDAVPEKYELKLSEGSQLKPEHLEEISTYAKSKNLTQEQAQELLSREEAVVKSHVDGQQKIVNDEIENWKVLTSQDKEIGGEALPQNLEFAKRALGRFGNDVFRGMLDATGFGNHPEVIRFFSKIGKAIAEDKIIAPGAQGGPTIQSMEEKFYGKK